MEALPEVNQKWIESLQGKLKIIILSNGIDRKIEEYFANKGIEKQTFVNRLISSSEKHSKEMFFK